MLEKVKSWEPPTSDHIGLKQFMIEQIETSMKYDIIEEYNDRKHKEIDIKEWYNRKLTSITGKLKYHIEQFSKEYEINQKNNKWIKDLRNSLINEE